MQILDEHPLTEKHLDNVQQSVIGCILWNEDRSDLFAIDQRKHLVQSRQRMRGLIHVLLEFVRKIRTLDEKDHNLDGRLQTMRHYLAPLNSYRTKRKDASDYFSENHRWKDALEILIDVDKEQFHHLQFTALRL
jgi:hypothetical protein